jgi:ankyrin repeat protein
MSLVNMLSRVVDRWSAGPIVLLLTFQFSACSSPSERARETLVSRGLDVGPEHFYRYLDAGDVETVALFIEAGVKPQRALRRAAKQGQCEMVKLLLDSGYDATRGPGVEALTWAIDRGHEECAQLLRAAGADPLSLDRAGENQLTRTAGSRNTLFLKIILRNDAELDAPNRNGETAVVKAVQRGRREHLRLLMKAGADLDVPDRDGWTALTYAARAGHEGMVRELIRGGADVNTSSKTGWTPLMLAALEGHLEVVKSLLQAGAHPDTSSEAGLTALIRATQRGDGAMEEALLHAGADPGVRVDGVDASWWAAASLHSSLSEALDETRRSLRIASRAGDGR